MKTLLILRHAKSSWEDTELTDHDRPLDPRGVRDAPRMGQLLASEGLVPDHVLTSTAVRAESTAELAMGLIDGKREIESTRELYLASPHTCLEVIAARGGDADRLMVVGHNPGITALVTRLTGVCEKMPTAGLAVVELDIDAWSEVESAGQGRLVEFWRPKDLY